MIRGLFLFFLCLFSKFAVAQNIVLKQELRAIIDKSLDTNNLTVFLQKSIDKNTPAADKIEYQGAYVNLLLALAKYDKAMQYSKENLMLYEQANMPYGKLVFNNLVGMCYYFLVDRKTAIPYFLKAYNYSKEYSFIEMNAFLASNLGAMSIEENKYGEAEKYLLESKKIFATLGDKLKNYPSVSLRLLGQVYEHNKQLDKAEAIYNEVDVLLKNSSDSSGLAINMGCLSRLYMQTNREAAAFELNKKSLLYADVLSKRDIKIAVREMYIENLSKAGNFKEALQLQQEIRALTTKYFTEDLSNKVSEAEAKYQTASIKFEKEKIETKNKQQKLIFGISFFALLALGSLFAYTRIQKIKGRQKIQFEKQKLDVIINSEEKERIRIARELHDGVGQTMIATSMNLQALKSNIADANAVAIFNKANDLLNNAIKEVREVSHSMVSSALLHSGLANAIKDFVEKIELPATMQIQLFLDGYSVKQPIEIESSLYRIVQESVNNAIKHAKATLIKIELKNEGSQLILLIEDNGVGFTASELKNKDGIGLNNLEARAQSLKGFLKFDSIKNAGTKILVQIPIV